jgi:hypothetical protein
MCIFSGPVAQVSGTQIFARPVAGDRQVLVYAMNVALDREVAMVLPLPVPPGTGDEAVSFLDLSGYATFFDDVAEAFPELAVASGTLSLEMSLGRAPLMVHDVGAFVASYVPSPADLDRLDRRFRVPTAVFANQAYQDWGFAVFQLKPHVARHRRRWFWQRRAHHDAGGPQPIHPMAFSFPTRRPRALFFPTLHVHDGASVPATAHYDHTLVCQSDDEVLTRTFGWRASAGRLGAHVDAARACGAIEPDAPGYRHSLHGELPNLDHWFEPPRCSGPDVLSGRGDRFAFDLAARAAYPVATAGPPATATYQARCTTALTRLDDLHAGLMAGLADLTAARAEAWALGRLGNHVPLHLSGNRPFRVHLGVPQRVEPGAAGPFEIAISAAGERVETQTIRFAFDVAPSPQIVEDIQRELAALLDRVVR